jgi:exodeoxyribonuclease VII small subunit
MFRRANSSDVNLRTLGSACTVRAMATRTPKEAPKLDFETAMRELEELVERLEQGELPLEESLAAFERGVMLTRSCQTALKDAEQKVEILLKKAGEPAVEDFEADESDANPAQLFE